MMGRNGTAFLLWVILAWAATTTVATFAAEPPQSPPPPRNRAEVEGVPDMATVKEIEGLIERLVEIKECDIGYSPSATGSKFAPLDDSTTSPLFTSNTPSPTLRKLVERGAVAVPHLVRHLDDKRKTKIPVEHVGVLGGLFCQCEYDWNPHNVNEVPREVVRMQEGDLSKEEYELPENYTITVGDLCYVALGQIVNREFNAVRYQPTGCIIVNSLAYSSKLRAAAKREWGNLTTAGHMKSLIADVRRPDSIGRACEALRRLSYYYPDTVEELAIEWMRKPFYSVDIAHRFVNDRLYQTVSDAERMRILDEFVKGHGDIYHRAILLQLLSDRDWDRVTRIPPLQVKVNPRDVLKQLYPNAVPNDAALLRADVVELHCMAGIIHALNLYPSRVIDGAVYDLFQQLKPKECNDRDSDTVAIACARRLKGKGHDKEFEQYFCRRIEQTPEAHKWWNVQDLKEALALARGETFAAWLAGDHVTEAELKRLQGLKLHRLFLSGPQVTDVQLKCLEDMKTLDVLEIRQGGMTDIGLVHLRHLTSLDYLSISGDGITDAGLAHLENLADLGQLYLAGPHITDAGMVHLKSLTKLRRLDLYGIRLTDAGLIHLRDLKQLEILVLRGSPNQRAHISAEALEELRKVLPKLQIWN